MLKKLRKIFQNVFFLNYCERQRMFKLHFSNFYTAMCMFNPFYVDALILSGYYLIPKKSLHYAVNCWVRITLVNRLLPNEVSLFGAIFCWKINFDKLITFFREKYSYWLTHTCKSLDIIMNSVLYVDFATNIAYANVIYDGFQKSIAPFFWRIDYLNNAIFLVVVGGAPCTKPIEHKNVLSNLITEHMRME